ncbi:MAG TPA: Spy/CpxP family protein refolding chaperone [Terriglobales bacterium]|nr:Spy/CpxP family protein refolding chaperone [Terriglobales bacterium]
MMLAGLVVLGVATIIAHRARAQDVAVTYPAIGMMSGGCPAMGWGGPMMMGVAAGSVPYGMMGWNNGSDGSTFIYHGMMGGNRVIQNSVIAGNATSGNLPQVTMPPSGMGPQMMAGNTIPAWPSQAAVIEGRLAFLRVALSITETQSAAWNAYADAVRNHAGRMQDTYQHHVDAMMQGDAISRIDARIQMMEAMLDAMKAIRPAIDQLYKALTSDQKQLANQLIGPDCNGM